MDRFEIWGGGKMQNSSLTKVCLRESKFANRGSRPLADPHLHGNAAGEAEEKYDGIIGKTIKLNSQAQRIYALVVEL